jgi:hypothetical protein
VDLTGKGGSGMEDGTARDGPWRCVVRERRCALVARSRAGSVRAQ